MTCRIRFSKKELIAFHTNTMTIQLVFKSIVYRAKKKTLVLSSIGFRKNYLAV